MGRFCMFPHFYGASFLIKTCFYETSNVFYLKYYPHFNKTIRVPESSIKVKIGHIVHSS